jgi:hypothetical protein
MVRFARLKGKCPASLSASSLEEFVKIDDQVSFGRATDRSLKVVHTFINKDDSLDSLKATLDSKL